MSLLIFCVLCLLSARLVVILMCDRLAAHVPMSCLAAARWRSSFRTLFGLPDPCICYVPRWVRRYNNQLKRKHPASTVSGYDFYMSLLNHNGL